MAYIIIVNPVILHNAGMPLGPVMVATIMAAAVATILTGVYAKRPFAMAPYMGENAFFAFAVVAALGVTWNVALAAVFVAGIIFFLISISGLRRVLVEAIPPFLAASWAVAIGLFLMFIGLANAGVSLPGIPGAPVTLGNFSKPEVIIAFIGIALTLLLYVKKVPGSILLGIIITMALGFAVGAAGFGEVLPRKVPSLVGPLPNWGEVLFKLDFAGLASTLILIPIIVVMFLMDFLDTAGTVMGLAARAGFLNEKGRFPGVEKVMHVDSLATILGALFGTSTTGTYIESATGIEQGGRTGLTAIVTGLLFLAALAFTPFFSGLPPGFLQLAAAPALVTVGILMMTPIRMINFEDVAQAIPATLTIAFMLFTYNIGFGLAVGLVAYPLVMAATGRRKQVHPLMWVLWVLGVLLFLIYPYH
ncbi:MAG: NCS2 family permease [Candidatus Hecatellales archaeon]|nr:MAG: NCS2 family permease [Candidatus Hecatellales archaeon]